MKNWFWWLVGAAILIAILDSKSDRAPIATQSATQANEYPRTMPSTSSQSSTYPVGYGAQNSYASAPDVGAETNPNAYPDPSYRHPQSASRVGSSTFYSDGTTAQRIGDATFYSDGTTAQRIGDSTFYSDGTTAQQIGDSTFYSDGTTAQRIGDATFNSDGTTCQTIGDSTFCN